MVDIIYDEELSYFIDMDSEGGRWSKERGIWISTEVKPSIKFKVTNLLELWLVGNKTFVMVSGKVVHSCMHLFMNLDSDARRLTEEAKSMDEIIDILQELDRERRISGKGTILVSRTDETIITPENVFVAHCSNFQAWMEHGFSTYLMDRNLAFPVLVELSRAGDKQAAFVLKTEVKERLASGSLNVLEALIITGRVGSMSAVDWNEVFNRLPDDETILAFARRMLHRRRDSFPGMVPDWVKEMVREVPDHIIMAGEYIFFNGVGIDQKNRELHLGKYYPVTFPDDVIFPREPVTGVVYIRVGSGSGVPGKDGPLLRDSAFLIDRLADPSLVKEISFTRCGLERVGGINKCTGVEEIHISNESISALPHLAGLPELRVLWFRNLAISSTSGLGDLPSLDTIKFMENEISVVDGLHHLRSLKDLSFRNEPIRDISGGCFPENLETIAFINCDLHAVDPAAIGGLHRLQTFTITQERFSWVPESKKFQPRFLENMAGFTGALASLPVLKKIVIPGPEPGNAGEGATFGPLFDAGFRFKGYFQKKSGGRARWAKYSTKESFIGYFTESSSYKSDYEFNTKWHRAQLVFLERLIGFG
ncbi:MAG: leucine-rich repeat domain-containing protein [Promethearchaeota archaeon]